MRSPDRRWTVSVTLQREDGRVLLLKRRAERGGFWQILTGRIEPGESPLQTAGREVHEETGFSPRLDEIRELGYAHGFALGGRVPPLFARETAFAATVSGEPKANVSATSRSQVIVPKRSFMARKPGCRSGWSASMFSGTRKRASAS